MELLIGIKGTRNNSNVASSEVKRDVDIASYASLDLRAVQLSANLDNKGKVAEELQRNIP